MTRKGSLRLGALAKVVRPFFPRPYSEASRKNRSAPVAAIRLPSKKTAWTEAHAAMFETNRHSELIPQSKLQLPCCRSAGHLPEAIPI